MKVPIEQVKLNPNNPRIIKDGKFEKLVQSIREFPEMAEVRELVVNKDYVVLGGNMRLRAMKEAGWKEVPIRVVDWSEDKQKEFVIKDNSSFGEWDYEALANEWDMQELDRWGLDLPKNFVITEVKEDEPPEVLHGLIKSEVGEIYQLGEHRVMCGDSAKKEDVERLMNGLQANMVFTDPPYGVSYVGKTSDSLTIKNDSKAGEELLQFLKDSFSLFPLVPGGAFYICAPGGAPGLQFRTALNDVGLSLRQAIVWVKNSMVLGRQDYQWKHEDILQGTTDDEYELLMYGWEDGTHVFNGGRKQTTVWEIDRPKTSRDHPTMKPIALCGRAIQNSSKDNEIVFDGFGGSGSTLMACEQLNRRCYTIELDPKYVDVIRKRWHVFVSGSQEGWEEATPAISGEEQVENAVS